MKSLKRSLRGFTLIELLVVISIIAILASLAVPAVSNALVRGQMTQTLNNARQLHMATQIMSTDTSTAGDGWSWTTSNGVAQSSLNSFVQALIDGRYLTAQDMRKILTAPGITIPQVSGTNLTVNANSVAFKILQTTDATPSDQVFVITKNWSSLAVGLDANASPYGDKGFVLFRKGGDGGIFNRPQDAKSTSIIGTNESALSYYLQ